MGHWYRHDGTSFHTTLNAKGQERPVTLRDARLVGAAPGVSDICGMLPAPFLVAWKERRAARTAIHIPRGIDMDDEMFLDAVKADCRQQSQEVMEEGSRIHDASECHYLGKPYPDRYRPHAEAIETEIARLFPDVHDWVIEKSFYHPLGFGGRVDRHSPSTGIVIDLKGKEGPLDEKVVAYVEQQTQLAAYQVGLGMDVDTAHPEKFMGFDFHPIRFTQCANIFVSRTHPGAVASHVWDAQDVADGWNIFEKALELWKALNHYNPADNIQPCAA